VTFAATGHAIIPGEWRPVCSVWAVSRYHRRLRDGRARRSVV